MIELNAIRMYDVNEVVDLTDIDFRFMNHFANSEMVKKLCEKYRIISNVKQDFHVQGDMVFGKGSFKLNSTSILLLNYRNLHSEAFGCLWVYPDHLPYHEKIEQLLDFQNDVVAKRKRRKI